MTQATLLGRVAPRRELSALRARRATPSRALRRRCSWRIARRSAQARRRPEIPDQTERRECAQPAVGEIDLAGAKPVARRGREAVVVVVPAVAERRERDPEVVPALVAARVALGPEAVAERVHGKGHVVEQRPCSRRSPRRGAGVRRARRARRRARGGAATGKRSRKRSSGKRAKSWIAASVRLAVAPAEQPSHVRPPEAAARRVDVAVACRSGGGGGGDGRPTRADRAAPATRRARRARTGRCGWCGRSDARSSGDSRR